MRVAGVAWWVASIVLCAPLVGEAQGSASKRVGSAAGAVFLVDGPGIVEVTASELAVSLATTADGASDLIESGWLDLRLGGESIAWHGVDEGAALRFWAPEVRSPFSRHHRVRVSIEQGRAMLARTPVAATATEPHAYVDTQSYETNSFPGPAGAPDPRQDLFFWHALSSAADVRIPIRLTGLAAPSAIELRVLVHGATEHPDQPFRVELRWNGQSLGVFDRFGRARHTLTASLDGVGAAIDNELVVAQRVAGDEPPVLYIDAIEVEYLRVAEADSASFRFAGASDGVHSVSGLSGEAAHLYDVTDQAAPVDYGEVRLDERGGLSFVAHGSDLRFALVTGDAVLSPIDVRPHAASDLRSAQAGADYLIIAPSHLLEDAGAFADYREADGYSVLSIDVEDIHWAFADGEPDPLAIRDFLAFAADRWETAPRFVLLVGNGSLDYRDLMGHGDNSVPPALAVTDGGLFPSDSMLGDFVGDDGVPEVAIGRLPVSRAEEIRDILEAIESFEATHPSLDTLFASDDSQYDEFVAASHLLAEWVPAERVREVDLTVERLDAARDRLLSMWGGLSWMTYVGHSSIDRMAAEGLVTTADVPALSQVASKPVVLGWTCNMVRFDIPGFKSLGEQLLVDGASAAIFSATGWSNHFESDLLRMAFAEAVFASDAETIGEAMLRAHRAAATASLSQHRVYMLLGDPALRIREKAQSDPEPPIAADPPAEPPSSPESVASDAPGSSTGCEIARRTSPRTPWVFVLWVLGAIFGARRLGAFIDTPRP